MYLNLKSTASVLALTLCFAIPNALSMDGGALRQDVEINLVNKPCEKLRISPSKALKVDVVRDIFPDSGSVTLCPYGQTKSTIQSALSEEMGHKEVRRILELDGGGIRGLFSIIELTVLEEIINHPLNKDPSSPYRYIRDYFDIGTGTSTGSILTAGLFSLRNYSATDVAKLYARYGYKIFDEHKRTVSPGLDIGVTCATYGNEGLLGLLTDHFGNALLQDVHKPIYIVAMNESKQEAAIFSSTGVFDDQDELHKTPMATAVLCSSSAPTFFPAVKTLTNGGTYLMSDGGTVANNPANLVYKQEKINYGNPFEIYSFGTGIVPSPQTRAADTGAGSVATILNNTLTAAEKLAYRECISEINAVSSQLHYFARINPKLEMGMDKLDDTSNEYREYAIQKAFSVTEGGAFAEMVSHLGLQMPDIKTLKEIQQAIRNKLDSLKSNVYEQLDKYEKEFVINRVLGLDFMFYQKRFYQDSQTGKVMQMQNREAMAFLMGISKDIAEKKKLGDGFVSNLWSYISTSNEDSILEFIPRCLDFHTVSDNKIVLTQNDITLLTSQGSQLTQTQLKVLSPTHKINGDGIWFSGSTALQTNTNTLASNLFLKFIECCDEGSDYKYSNYNSSYIHLPALIFWKDTLKDIEGQVTKQQLMRLKAHLADNVSQIMVSRAYLSQKTAEAVYGSRYGVLVSALDAYIAKFCKN